MKALFVTDDYVIDPLGIAWLSSYLKDAGHEVDIAKANDGLKDVSRPDMLCYSVTTGKHTYYRDLNLQLQKEKGWRVPAVFGGPHPTFFPAYALEPRVDVCVRGEGFDAVVELADAFQSGGDLATIPNVVYHEHINPLQPIKDKSGMLFPDRELIYKYPENYNNPIKNVMCSFGCPYSCPYCVGEDTLVLMANGTSKPIKDIRIGDKIIGVDEDLPARHTPRKYREATVEAVWQTEKPAYEIELEDGTKIVCSADHRWLSRKGWLRTIGVYSRDARGRFLPADPGLGTSPSAAVLGIGGAFETPEASVDYRRGYLNGMIRGDGTVGNYIYKRKGRTTYINQARRCCKYLQQDYEINMKHRILHHKDRKPLAAIDTYRRADVDKIQEIIVSKQTTEFRRGFLAGIFDAEGHTQKVLSGFCFSNRDKGILQDIKESLEVFGFRYHVFSKGGGNFGVWVRGGLRETVRFFQLVNPAIARKFRIDGVTIQGRCKIKNIKALGETRKMYDITTSCGTFLANGYISHNCYNAGYKQLYHGNTLQIRPVDSIISEIEDLRKYPLKLLFFNDDIFPLYKPSWLWEFCDAYESIGIRFHIQIRIEYLAEEALKRLKSVGLHGVTFAVESGNQQLRRDVLRRPMTDETILRGADLLHRYGIKTRTENMVGIPGETWDTAMETLDLNSRCNPSLAWASVYQPYPGTVLGNQCYKDGIFDGDLDSIAGSFFDTYRLDVPNAKRFERLQKLFSVAVEYPKIRRWLWVLVRLPLDRIYKYVYTKFKRWAYNSKLYSVE